MEAKRLCNRLEAENDSLNLKLDAEIKNRMKNEKARKKIGPKTLIIEESDTQTLNTPPIAKLEAEIASFKEGSDKEAAERVQIERVCDI
jgi:hypothetical protein